MIYEIFHETIYNYPSLVTFSHNIARLTPKTCKRQELLEHEIEISPTSFELNTFKDYFENNNTFMLIREAHKELKVVSKSKVRIHEEDIKKLNDGAKKSTIKYVELKNRLKEHRVEDLAAIQYLFETTSIPAASDQIVEYVLESFTEDRTVFQSVHNFMERIFTDFKFVSGFSDITTPIDVVFQEKKGVCQDFAQFAISALRTIGIPTRYISGYIQTYPKEGEEKLFGSDASHAWFSVYIPDFGWVDFDPTNNKMPNHEYMILGYGRDYLDISPLKGVVKSSGESNLKVRVNVERLDKEEPEKEEEKVEIQTQVQQTKKEESLTLQSQSQSQS